MFPFEIIDMAPGESRLRLAFYLGETVVFLVTILIALVILALTLATFDRCMGRASERPRRAPRSSRRTAKTPRPHVPVIDVHQSDLAPVDS